jgi:hypothetical protein
MPGRKSRHFILVRRVVLAGQCKGIYNPPHYGDYFGRVNN